MGWSLPLVAFSLAATAANPWLESAKDFYSRLECDRVLVDLESARQVPTNDLATSLSILDYTGRCQVALGHRLEADAAFTQMLALDPQAELDPGLSPKIREAFKAAKLRLYPEGYLALKELPATEGLVRAELVDPWKRAASVVAGRWNAAAQRFDEEVLRAEGKVYLVRVTAGASWFLEARSSAGEALALLGKKTPPVLAPAAGVGDPAPRIALEQRPPAERSRTRSVAGWATAGVGALAVVTGIALWAVSASTRGSAERAPWGDDAFALDGLATTQRNWGTGLFFGGAAVAVTGAIIAW